MAEGGKTSETQQLTNETSADDNTSICSSKSIKSNKTVKEDTPENPQGNKITDRQETKELNRQLNEVIENCSVAHKSLHQELSKDIDYERLDSIQKGLALGQQNVVAKHDELKTLNTKLGIHDLDIKMTRQIDGVIADSKNLISLVTDKMNSLSARDKSLKNGPPSISKSRLSKAKSKSIRSGSSRASSSLRAMQLEAQANCAAMEKRLQKQKQTQILEQKAQQLTQAIENQKLETEVEAARAKEQVISQAMEEEEMRPLFRPPSQSGKMPPENTVDLNVNPIHTHEPQVENANNQDIISQQYDDPQNRYRPIAMTPITIKSDNEAFAETLAQAINSIKLKPAEPSIFYGEPLTYLDWKVAFEGLIEGGRHTPLQKLAYLQQYLGGKAKEAVAGYFQIGTEEAFRDAKRKLDTRFGQPYVISEAYRTKLEHWPVIRDHDGEGLQKLADFLESCKTAMSKLPELQCLNDRRENEKIIEKLPYPVASRWVQRATQIEANTLKFPTLFDFCSFLTKEANVATNSLSKALAKRAHSSKKQADNTNTSTKRHAEKKTTSFLAHDNPNDSIFIKSKRARYPCLLCNKDNHSTGVCFKLGKLHHSDLEKFFTENNLCFACSKPGHKMDKCNHPETCNKTGCGRKHLAVFHEYYRGRENKTSPQRQQSDSSQSRGSDHKTSQNHQQPNQSRGSADKTSQPQPANTGKTETQANNQATATARNCTDTGNPPANLKSWTCPVYVSTKENPSHEVLVYALLDSGSNHSFVTQNTLQKLHATTHDTDMKISTLTDVEGTKSNRQAATGLLVRGYKESKYIELPTCASQSQIPFNRNEIPNSMSVQDWPHLSHLASEFISAREGNNLNLGLLIGNNLPQVFISRQEVVGNDNEPFARLSDLGWLLMGNTNQTSTIVNLVVSEPTTRKCVSYKIHANSSPSANGDTNDSLESKILKIFSSDFTSADENKTLSIDDLDFLKLMKEHIHKDKEGFITMPLPLKHKPGLNKSKFMAMNRFKLLQKKLTDETFSEHYHEFMNDIISQGDAELIPNDKEDPVNSWYIPHFGVYHPKKPGKIRVVFDGAAKVGGMCLNDYLLQGPDQMNSLVGILMRFRKEMVGVTCDIGRMFHQFRVSPEHRDYLRFLWFDKQGNIATYRMKVHLFGATSSPACATYGLRHLCDISNNENPKAKSFIKHNFYVDDGLISFPDSDPAKALVHDAISICKEGNLRLHKFSSNSSEFLQSLPESERNIQDTQTLDPGNDCQPTERTLGLLWSLKADSFRFSSSPKINPSTRRGVLSTIASIYDPLGFLSPFILQGKNILQDMCRIATSWDDPLTGDLLSRWEGWKSSLSDLSSINIKRCYKPADFGEISKAEVHHFSDASTSGYGEVSYLRLVNTKGKVHCSLLMSKARVAPLKPVTIPRLELQAAVTSSQVSSLVKSELGLEISDETFWTDSQVVLGYLRNTTKKFHVYVTNRIQQVRDNSSPEKWLYVPTSINPADHASRGLTPAQLIQSNWFTGPDFLWHEPLVIPEQLPDLINHDDPEVKSLFTVSQRTSLPDLYQRLNRFSSWKKAVKVTNVFLRKVNSKNQTHKYNAAEQYIIKSLQRDSLTEYSSLVLGKPITKSSTIFNLKPFLDEEGIMRVGGRLVHSTDLEYQEKHPIILPKNTHMTSLLLRHFHEQVAHQGRGFTLSKMRSSGYWIIGARNLVASLINKCVVCRLHRAKPGIPQMSPLPPERSTQSPPFSYCGVDCFGPFLVKDRRTELKRYGLMVTCLASRAVHIELLDDMTTSSFINGIRNVIAIRGPVQEIWCDQGTNFIGAIPELTDKGVLEFKLNPPSASHMGGVWERMIRTARSVLQTLLRQHGGRLDTSGLRTLMYEVMAIINSRPLSIVTDEDTPLTPNQLLTMKSDIILPPPTEFDSTDLYSRKRWRAVQHLANVFWGRWRSEYLSVLQTRQKWVTGHSKTKVGDIVLIKDENTHRNAWAKAKIVQCIESADGHVRSAKLLVGNRHQPNKSDKYLTRPVSKIVTLIHSDKVLQ